MTAPRNRDGGTHSVASDDDFLVLSLQEFLLYRGLLTIDHGLLYRTSHIPHRIAPFNPINIFPQFS